MNKKTIKYFFKLSFLLVLAAGSGCKEVVPDAEQKRTIFPLENNNHKGPNKVEILQQGAHFQLLRNGEPYFIKGICGREKLEAAVAAGANSVRTYTTSGLDTLLDKAHALGLSVMVGIWLGREIEGFNYDDAAAVKQQKEEVEAIVNRYKDHPAVLFWTLGNEPDNSATKTKSLWKALDDLAVRIHQLDPNHPVTTATWSKGYKSVFRYCPNIDFLSINAFGNMKEFHHTFPKDKPFLFSEWGALGPWEVGTTFWHAAMEPTVREKFDRIMEVYPEYVLNNSGRCFGSYIFYWGQKQEYTPTWFSFFTEDGAETPLVDAMTLLWNGAYPNNRAPFLDSLTIDGKGLSRDLEISVDEVHTASVRPWDPDGDTLKLVWEIIPDGPFFKYVPGEGKVEIRPEPIPGLIRVQSEGRIVFLSPPNTGAYRLLVHAYDGNGNGASANLPFFLVNNNLTDHLTH